MLPVSELAESFGRYFIPTLVAVLVSALAGLAAWWRVDVHRLTAERLRDGRRHDKELAQLHAAMLEEARANARQGVEFLHAVSRLEAAREALMARAREGTN